MENTIMISDSELNKGLKELKNGGETMHFQSDIDIASIRFSGGMFLFMLNSKCIFGMKTLKSFEKKALKTIEERHLLFDLELS